MTEISKRGWIASRGETISFIEFQFPHGDPRSVFKLNIKQGFKNPLSAFRNLEWEFSL